MFFLIINGYIKNYSKKYFLGDENLQSVEYILVLGAKAYPDGRLSLMLKDRVDASVYLYEEGKGSKIIMSGALNEVTAMKEYAILNGVLEEDILLDDKGLSTIESILVYRDSYKDKSLIIVSQKYHLYRACYIGRKLGLEAYAHPSEDIKYYGQYKRDIREGLARVKDFFYVKKFVDK